MTWSELNEEETNKMVVEALNHIEKNSEHTLTWEELKEEAKKDGYVQGTWENCITNGLFEFYKSGDIVVFGDYIAKDRTPDQMLAIMKALQ